MEANQGPPFQTQYSHPSDYLPAEHDPDSIESFGSQAPAHPSAYTNGGATDPLRRDGNAANSTYTIASARNLHGARYLPESGLAVDGSYRPGNTFPDSSTNSIEASPSSGSSQFGYNAVNTVPVNHFGATLPTLSNSVIHAQQRPSYHTGYRTTANLENSAPGLLHLPPPSFLRSPSQHHGFTTIDRDAYLSPSFLTRSQFPLPGFQTFEAPRNSLSSPSVYPGHGYVQTMPQSAQNGKGERECSEFPFPELECCADLICEGHSITPDVKASMDKGFFWDPHDQKWTCYRRNYFSVHCYYTLTPNIPNGRLFLKRSDGTMDLVQAIGIRVQAAVDAPNGKTIELIQHTPKRDAGPKTDVKMFNMMPAMSDALTAHQLSTPIHGYTQSQQLYRPTPTATGPSLAFQDYVEPPSPEEMATAQASRASGSAGPGFLGGGQPQIANPGQETTHLFERIQFKCATANNGKRRATQQYFHLVAELHVDTRKAGDPVPQWNLVAKRTSDKVVVRGRSPSHYQDNANGGNGRGNGGAGRKFGGGSGARNMGHGMGPQMRSPGAGSSTTAGASMGYSGTNFGSFSFRTQTHYGLQGSPSDSGSGSDGINSSPFDDVSGSSGDGVHNSVNSHTFDESHQEPATISGSGRGVIRDINGYGYYPSPMYGGTSHQLPVPKSQGQPHVSTEPRDHAFRAEFPDGTVGTQWHFHGNQGQFQPWKNSKNLFPHIGGSYS